jgi:hypothetical protein
MVLPIIIVTPGIAAARAVMLGTMDGQPEMVTVFRSMDASAEADCQIVMDMLSDEDVQAVLLDDTAPGVPEGVYEVQVPAADVSKAEGIIAANPLPDDEEEEADPSHELDVESIYHAEGSIMAGVETGAIISLLEANGIATVTTGESILPHMPFDIKVAHDQVERARRLIEEAQRGGPRAAEEAELQGEEDRK